MAKPIKLTEEKGIVLPIIVHTRWNKDELNMKEFDDFYKWWLEKYRKRTNHIRKMFTQKAHKKHHIKLLNHSRKTFKRK